VEGRVNNDYQNKQEKKMSEIQDRYEEAKQIADKTFEIVEGQLSKLENYIENDANEKAKIEQEYSKQLHEANEVINIRFEQEAQARVNFEKKFKQVVAQRFDMLKNDLMKEAQMRNASIQNLEQ
jgi:cell division protein FtsX